MTTKQWTLPLKTCAPQLVEIQPSKKRKLQKDVGLQTLQNEIAKFRTENKMLKDFQKELTRDLLNMEMERNMLKGEVESLYMKKNHVASLMCILEIMMAAIENMGQTLQNGVLYRQLNNVPQIMF